MIKIKITLNNKEEDINLLNDYLFSKLFSEKGSEKETIYLINTFTGKNFKTLSYEPNELKGFHKGNKKSVTDVLVEVDNNTLVNIESQIESQKKFFKRSHFYNSRLQSLSLEAGEKHEDLPMSIMINILDFNLYDNGNYHKAFIFCDKINKPYTIEDIEETHYIELPKFRKELKKGNIDLNNPKDRLMLLLDKKTPQNLINKVMKMDKFANQIYDKAQHILKDKQEYLTYIRIDQAERDEKARIRHAKEKGIKKGKEEIALKLKKSGSSPEQIAEITELPIKKIKEL